MPSEPLRRVIFTADDFGLSVPVNEAVERAHQAGGVPSLMAEVPRVERARRLPDLHVGLHPALVNGAATYVADLLLADAAGQLSRISPGRRVFSR